MTGSPLNDLAGTALSAFLAARNARKSPSHTLMGIFLVVLGGAAVTIGLGCAIVSLWLYLIPVVGTTKAPLIIGGGFVVLGAILAAIGHYEIERRAKVAIAAQPPRIPPLPLVEIFQVVKRHKVASLLIVTAIGMMIGGKPSGPPPHPDEQA